MKIGFIGAGRVGFSLGRFFARGGVTVTGYCSRRRGSAREAAQFTGTKAFDTPNALLQQSDAVFLTVPDDAISPVFSELRRFEISEKIICHCSGAMTAAEALPGLSAAGAYGYSIHPLFPVNSKRTAYRELADAFFCLEGEGPHLPLWKNLLESLGARVQLLAAEDKARYHAACVFASNLACALAQESMELLEQCGFSRDGAAQALAPLMRANLEHILRDGPVRALTGPVERGDCATVEKHLACLSRPGERALYRAASRKLAEMAAQKHPERDYRPLERLLAREEGEDRS